MICYKNEIFPVALVLSYDVESVNKEYYNVAEGEEDVVYIKPTSAACTMFLTHREKSGNMAVGILFNKTPDARLGTHEALHAAIMMLDVGCHIPLNESTEEVYAYMIGWIGACIQNFIEIIEHP